MIFPYSGRGVGKGKRGGSTPLPQILPTHKKGGAYEYVRAYGIRGL